jgi:NodT family efflux transporter outer membrane factor (OMF) lipoprotein
MRAVRSFLLGSVAVSALLLSGCMVGPDFMRPKTPDSAGYTAEKIPELTTGSEIRGGEPQRLVDDMDIPGQWWTLFHSPELNKLIEQALRANPTLQAAQATLRQAQENVYAQQGALLPSADLDLSSAREKITGASFGATGFGLTPFTVHTAQVSVSYPLDVFGGIRRQVESFAAQAEFQQFQLEASYLTLTTNVVLAAVGEASLRGQIVATQDIIQIQSDQLKVLQQQFELGGTSQAAVLAQEAALAQTKAILPPLQRQLAQQRNLLAVLAGRFPNDSPSEPFDIATLSLPQDLPLSLPSKLVDQRPDIRSAEAQVHQTSAQVGVATANMLPQITLSGGYGRQASLLEGLGNPKNEIWNVAAGLTQPLFRGGTLLHEKRAAQAAFEAAAAQYRSTVLAAFQNVADALRALESDAQALAAQVEAERSSLDSLELQRQQYQFGAITYTSLLDAERTYLLARVNVVIAQANRFADTAALFQALGGGWWNRTDVQNQKAAGRRDGTRVEASTVERVQ